ncbi:MAG: hypothetical protein MZW92_79150 [Comamonadaceae bacterium]|nr:hypothetical protein [Comamonadaceae bacterium]
MPRAVPGRQVRRLQLRRGRAGHLQGPRHPALQPALGDRGHGHRRLRDGRDASATTTSTARSGRSTSASRRRWRRRAPPASSASNILGSRLRLPAARPPRLRRLHLRRGDRAARIASRARRASRASSRRSRRASACTASRPRSTTPRPSPRCRGSSATAAQAFLELRQAEQRRHQAVLGVGPRRTSPGNYEVPLGTPFAEAARDGRRHARRAQAEGGDPRRLVGAGAAGRRHDGLHHGLRLHRQGRLDARLGRGHRDGRDASAWCKALERLSYFYYEESCGQCTPCREGTGWLYRVVAPHRARRRAGRRTWTCSTSVADNIEGRTICALGDAAAMPVQSFLKHFRDEFEYHIEHKTLPGAAGRAAA